MNKPALNESRDIHFGLSTTKATTRKRGTPLSLTDFAKKEISDRLTRIGTKGRLSSETMKIDRIGIKAELNFKV